MNWIEPLKPYSTDPPLLFNETFIARWGAASWQPGDDDRRAAGKLHIQLISRIATQRLGYLEGDEKTALKSVYDLFQQARDICTEHPESRHFETLTWHVLNTHVRPFTAKWHRESERGTLTALDGTDDFRAELNALRLMLARLDHLLLFVRDGVGAPWPVDGAPPKIRDFDTEMNGDFESGIKAPFSGFTEATTTETLDAINEAEREAIRKRREHYGLDDMNGTTALAISGGGIRSATFSLGVLVSLAQRGLLHQFDYLSTVSGGGYVGAFLSTFLQSPRAEVGLLNHQLPFRREEGEAAALRHIRHHSKYLAIGTTWERIKMFSAQLLGMALNALSIVWILVLLVTIEESTRDFLFRIDDGGYSQSALLYWALLLVLAGATLSLLVLRLRKPLMRYADAFVAVPLALLGVIVSWLGLGLLHEWYGTPFEISSWSLGDKDVWVAALGAVPVIAPALGSIFPRLLKRFGGVLVGVSALAAPIFLLGLYLFLYEHISWLKGAVFGTGVPLGIVLVVAGGLVYVFAFDINATSPHRHYRRKLAQAYLIQPKQNSENRFNDDVPVKLSDIGGRTNKAPYHLINCALNVPASSNSAMQGRFADFFLFSPAYSGSPLIGYSPTREWEARDAHLDLGTAMAISGAAAAPQMGLGTIKRFSFWLALLNIRLGYWARQPRSRQRTPGSPGILHLMREMFGAMDERGPWINLSDGGHIENLGIYELLRRRCRYIVAIDGEEDARMAFQGLTTLQRLAAIDLGVSIEIDLDDLRLKDNGLSRSHFRFCRIRYPKAPGQKSEQIGYLVYVKLSLTGNEGEFIRRYRLDEPVFPHHSTTDQFFNEAQFEAYRSLGEHIGNKLFLHAVVGNVAEKKTVTIDEWFRELGKNLLEPLVKRREIAIIAPVHEHT